VAEAHVSVKWRLIMDSMKTTEMADQVKGMEPVAAAELAQVDGGFLGFIVAAVAVAGAACIGYGVYKIATS
jgi:hypothetical protein